MPGADPIESILRRVVGLPLLMVMSLLAGCAAGIHTTVEEARVPRQPPEVMRLAVMPLVTEHGSEGVAPNLSPALHGALDERFPGLIVMGPEETAERLAASPAAATYAALLADYERTGVVESARLARISDALDVDHFLQVHAAYVRERFLDTELFGQDVASERRQVLLVVARLWGSAGPGPVWEAVVRTSSETDDFQHRERGFDELVGDLVTALAEWIPLG